MFPRRDVRPPDSHSSSILFHPPSYTISTSSHNRNHTRLFFLFRSEQCRQHLPTLTTSSAPRPCRAGSARRKKQRWPCPTQKPLCWMSERHKKSKKRDAWSTPITGKRLARPRLVPSWKPTRRLFWTLHRRRPPQAQQAERHWEKALSLDPRHPMIPPQRRNAAR